MGQQVDSSQAAGTGHTPVVDRLLEAGPLPSADRRAGRRRRRARPRRVAPAGHVGTRPRRTGGGRSRLARGRQVTGARPTLRTAQDVIQVIQRVRHDRHSSPVTTADRVNAVLVERGSETPDRRRNPDKSSCHLFHVSPKIQFNSHHLRYANLQNLAFQAWP